MFSKFKVQIGPTRDAQQQKPEKKVHRSSYSELPFHPSLSYLWAIQREQDALPYPVDMDVETSDTSSVDSDVETNPAAAYLDSLNGDLLELFCNEKNFNHRLVQRHVGPGFSVRQDVDRTSRTRDDYLALWAESMEMMPNFHMDILDSSVDMHESGKKAQIWTLKRMSGIPASMGVVPRPTSRDGIASEICKEGIGGVSWELKGNLWMCVRLQMLWGVSEFE